MRTVRFPDSRPLGTLTIREHGAPPLTWRELGAAQGTVVVPDNVDLRLSIRVAGGPLLDPQQVVVDDLGVVAALDPDTIQVLAVRQAHGVDFAPLAQVPELQELHLSVSGITDADLARLPVLRELRVLLLGGTRITDAGLRTLARFPALTVLDLTDTAITDAGLAQLVALSTLTTLIVSGTRITRAAAGPLAALPALQTVYFSWSSPDHAELAYLRTALPGIEFVLWP